jgi:hypothetical protein
MSYKLLVRAGIMLALVFTIAAEFVMHPSTAHAAASAANLAVAKCLSGGQHCSISHYVNFSDWSQTDSMLKSWAMADADRVDPSGDGNLCAHHYYYADVVAVLDFGSPNLLNGSYGITNWQGLFLPYGSINTLAFDYAMAYYNRAGVCSHLWVAIGINNDVECFYVQGGYSNNCNWNAGKGLAQEDNTAEGNLQLQGGDVPLQLRMAGADDIEYDNTWAWDTYNMTTQALLGFANFSTTTGVTYFMFDYGYSNLPCGDYRSNNVCGGGGATGTSSCRGTCAYNCTTRNANVCGNPIWDYGEMYNVAWGIGNDVPLLECYSSSCYDRTSWGAIYNHTGSTYCVTNLDCVISSPMIFWGVMTGALEPRPAWQDSSNNYGTFLSNFPASAVNYTAMDTCMANGPTSGTSPCY